jgi:hypothetical protein
MDNGVFNPSEDYQSTIKVMCDLHSFWNLTYFNGELIAPVITVRQDMRGRSYGWFVPRNCWKDSDDCDGSPEINICSQHLNRPLEYTAETMLHEMVHQYAYVKGIKDTSRYGYYHNKQFKEIAERHGLRVSKSDSYHGWCVTELTDESKEHLKDFIQDGKIIYDTRPCYNANDYGPLGERLKHSSTRKYICCNCGLSIRATRKVRVICAECNQLLMEL